MLKRKEDNLKKRIEALEKQVLELTETFETLKATVAERKRVKEVKQKQKWLNGYPDETGKTV